MANRRAVTPEMMRELQRLVEQGGSLTEAASLLDVSYKTVQSAAKALGLKPRTRPRVRIPPETRTEVVRLYGLGKSTGQIARDLGVSDTWVQQQLKLANVAVRPAGVLADRTAEIAERYLAGETTGQISRDLRVSDVAVGLHLKRQGVRVRPAGLAIRKYPLRDDALDVLNPDAAYWVGFLMADGCVSETGRITLALQARDHGHIREWLKFLGTPERPVNTMGGKARAQVSSPRLAQALAHHGVVVRKTDSGAATSDEAAKHPAFWRGMIDGDGNITLPSGKHGPSVGLCGSRVLMEQYADFLATAVLDGFRPRVLAVHGTTVIQQVKVEGRRARGG